MSSLCAQPKYNEQWSVKVLCQSLQQGGGLLILLAQLKSNCITALCFLKFPPAVSEVSSILLFLCNVDVHLLKAAAFHCRGSCIPVKGEVISAWYGYFTNSVCCDLAPLDKKDYINVSITAESQVSKLLLSDPPSVNCEHLCC